MATVYKPGDKVPASGIYDVLHDSEHTERHQVTVIYGKIFPPCNHCGNKVRYKLAYKAKHIESHDLFK
jgi:hypothetical protein